MTNILEKIIEEKKQSLKRIKKENSNSVWQYYELLGVQAVPKDLINADIDESYFLANNVIETDYTLRKGLLENLETLQAYC